MTFIPIAFSFGKDHCWGLSLLEVNERSLFVICFNFKGYLDTENTPLKQEITTHAYVGFLWQEPYLFWRNEDEI